MTRLELVTNGKEMLFTARRKTPAIQPLGKKQIQWCKDKWPSFADRRVVQRKDRA